jgi:TolB-like protein/DNA-binding winged helix-turn-helix (wHTH) protein/Flp pilus assembly protein TadD
VDPNREFRLGEWQVTPLRGVLHRADETRRLTPKAMDVLLCLVRHHGDVVARDTLLEEAWEGRAFSDEPLNKCIAEIRRQFGDDRGDPTYIETIPKRGYRLIAEFEPIGASLSDDAADNDMSGARRHQWLQQAALMLVLIAVMTFVIRAIENNDEPPGGTVALAVLPFEMLSADDSQDYFADGMHEELISVLSQNRGLSVRSRTSTLQYRETTESIPSIGETLDVDVIVEGSVRYDDDRVRVTAQLVDAATDAHLWSGNYDETLTVAELFSIQNRIATEIGTALELTLATAASETGPDLPTDNLQAYEYFMLGKYHYRRQLPGDMEQSVNNFEAAVALDPLFADAWDWLAYAYNHAATSVGHMSPHDAYPKARAAALRALEIEADLATAVSILGYIRAVYDWDWVGAELDLRRAIELDPDDSGTVWSLAHVLSILRRHDEAIELVRDFAERNPDIGRRHLEVANRLLDAGRYDEALTWLTRAEERGAEKAQVADTTGVALLARGDLDDALERFEYAVDARQRAAGTVARLAFVYARSGREDEAEALVEELVERSDTEPVSALTLATARLGLGDESATLDLLEQAAAERDRGVLSLPQDPFFRDLRDKPRYLAIVAGFGIP